MKSKVVAFSLLASSCFLGYTSITFADTEFCYTPSGYISMQNLGPNDQVGDIQLILENPNNNEIVFYNTGTLVGHVTDRPSEGVSILSHTAKFSKDNNQNKYDSFVTNGDVAMVVGIREFDGYGNPCAFDIYEEITEIAVGTKFYKNVTRANIGVLGYVSFCPGANINEFDILPNTLDGEPSEICFNSAKPKI